VNASCRDCGARFEARGRWQRRCWSCWREEQDEARRRSAYGDGYREGLAAGRRLAASPARLDAPTLLELIKLVHPDLHPHERFQQANRATRLLVGMLEQARARERAGLT